METGDFRHTESRLSGTGSFWIIACLICLIKAQPALAFAPGAITCQSEINFNGNNVTVDSFDSSDLAYSYWKTNLGYGFYTNTGVGYEPCRKANGNLATASNITGIVFSGIANIYGHVATGPDGSIELGSQGSVGDLSWVPSLGIQQGYAASNMSVVFPDVTLPTTNWIQLANNTSITNSGFFTMNQVNGNMIIAGTNQNMINVVLYATNGINLSGNRLVTIGTNASVTIYAGNIINDGGNGAIRNISQHASQMVIYGLPSLTSVSLHGNGPFWGLIYAPNAVMNVKGAGYFGYYGAFVCYSVLCTGNTTFSYDESLAPVLSNLLAAATLNASNNLTNSQFDLKVAGYPGFNYVIESSTNLADWTSVTTNTVPFTYSEINKGDLSQHFFRAIYLP